MKSVDNITFVGRHRLLKPGIRVHGHNLVDYIILKLRVKESDYYLTAYRDDTGKIAYVEQTT